MESASDTITYDVFIGAFLVIEVKNNAITINLGQNVHITMHCASAVRVKVGDKLPLFTRIPLDANARLSYIISGGKTPSDR
jgi:hypothetical protein